MNARTPAPAARSPRRRSAVVAAFAAAIAGCSSDASAPDTAPADAAAGATPAASASDAAPSAAPDAPTPGDAATPSEAAVPDAGSITGGDAAAPAGFWDATNIPPAKNVMTFKFLNRTNGKFADSEVYWHVKIGTTVETHSIAEQPTYDMPANSSGRMYFYLCAKSDATCAADPTKSKYYDFVEHTIGAHQYNGNTTRVDAFGLKIAMRLRCTDGFDVAVGEDYATFQEDRAATFQAFIDAVPAEFKALAQAPNAPYRIVQPGAGGFDSGGAHATYYGAFVDDLWSKNGLTIPKPGPNGSGLGSYPNISAAIYRHVGNVAGTFDPTGKLLAKSLWSDATTFYGAAPADYYARFWHTRAIDGKAYGFPYDDVGGYSSYISHANPEYMLVAIGW